MHTPEALVRYLDATQPIDCPYGNVRRVVTGGEGGIANVHVVTVSKGNAHYHEAYAETYFVLSGNGTITIDGTPHPLRPGAVVVLPQGCVHSLDAVEGEELEFVIFGTPPVPITDEAAAPRKPA